MLRTLPCLVFLAALGTPASPARAQDRPLPVAVTRTAVPPRAVLFDAPGDGSLWAKGTTYKMRFGDGAAMLVPVFGPRAPRNLPLTLRLAGARLGSQALPLRAPSVVRDFDRVVLDHGSVREVWRLAADHAEQDFVVDAAGADTDLVVRLAVDTPLAAPVRSPEGGLRFDAGDLGSVHYGDAVIVDGAGRRLAQPVVFAHGALELTVPAAFVRTARGPITIDPVIRVITVDNSPLTQQAADTAYESGSDVWLVVYEEVVSANDTDIISRRFDASGNFLDEVAVDITNSHSVVPAVASNRTTSQFLVVWEDHNQTAFVHSIQGRTRLATNANQGSRFTISIDLLLGGLFSPDVGGSPNLGVTDFFVVWSKSGKIEGALVSANSTAGPVVGVATRTIGNFHDPAISKSSGPGRAWMVTYTASGLASGIEAALVTESGTVAQKDFVVTAASTDVDSDVAGNGTEFLVVWQGGSPDTDVFGRRLRVVGSITAPGTVVNLTQAEPGTTLSLPQTHPRVANHSGCRWTYTYQEGSAGVGNTDVFAAVVMGDATPVFVEGHVLLSAGGSAVKAGGVASVEEAGETTQPGRALATFFTVNVFGALLDGLSAGGGVTTVQTGCGGPLFEPGIAATGEPALGARFTVSLQLQAGSAAAIFIGLPLPPLPLCSFGCALGVSPILLSVPAASVTLNVPCSASLLLGQFAFQGIEVPTTTHSTCSVGVPLRMTDTLLVRLR